MVSEEARKDMERVFRLMDIGDKGHVTPADLAGGEEMTMQAWLLEGIMGTACKHVRLWNKLVCDEYE